MIKEFWKPILVELNFPEERYDDLYTYIGCHIYSEAASNPMLGERWMSTTLPLALNVLSKVNDLDKIHFLELPINKDEEGKVYTVGTYVISIDLEKEYDKFYLKESYMKGFVEKTIHHINEITKEKEVYLYALFSSIRITDKKYFTQHRYYLK